MNDCDCRPSMDGGGVYHELDCASLQHLRPCPACDGFGDLPTGECNPGDMGVIPCPVCKGGDDE